MYTFCTPSYRLNILSCRLPSATLRIHPLIRCTGCPPARACLHVFRHMHARLAIRALFGCVGCTQTCAICAHSHARQVLGVLEPCLRLLSGGGEWQVVSRGTAGDSMHGVHGVVLVEATLSDVQYRTYDQPTVLVVDRIAGAWAACLHGCLAWGTACLHGCHNGGSLLACGDKDGSEACHGHLWHRARVLINTLVIKSAAVMISVPWGGRSRGCGLAEAARMHCSTCISPSINP